MVGCEVQIRLEPGSGFSVSALSNIESVRLPEDTINANF